MFNAVKQAQKKKVVITIHDASSLRSTQMFGKQDPYVIAFVEGDNQRRRVKTHTDEDGGCNPSWNRKLASLDYLKADKSDVVVFEIWNENSMSDSLIGQASCNLHELWNPTERSVNLPITFQGARSGSGMVRVSAHFTDNKTVAQTGASILQRAVSQPPVTQYTAAPRRPSMSSQVIQQSTPQGSAEWAVGPKAQDEESTAPTAPTALPSSGVQAITTKRSVEITIPNGVHPGNTITVRQNLTQKKFRLSLSLFSHTLSNLPTFFLSLSPSHPHPHTHIHIIYITPTRILLQLLFLSIRQVNLPDGRSVKVTVPQGMKPGNKMQINYEVQPKPQSKLRNAVVRAVGPSVSIGQSPGPGMARPGSYNNSTGTGIGFRGGYQPNKTPGAQTMASVGLTASRFRGATRASPVAAPVGVTPYPSATSMYPSASLAQSPRAPSASTSFATVMPYPSTAQPAVMMQQPRMHQPRMQQPMATVVQPMPYPSAVQPGYPTYMQPPQQQQQQHRLYNRQPSYGQQPSFGYQQPYGQPTYQQQQQQQQQQQPAFAQSQQYGTPMAPTPMKPAVAQQAAAMSLEKVQQMRMVIGIGSATEGRVRELLALAYGDVNRAIASFYDAGGK